MSNYSMRQDTAEMFVHGGAFTKVLKIMRTFPNDRMLTWLACSLLWNLARPPTTRHLIPFELCDLLWEILARNTTNKNVMQCALGALSNIAICERFQKPMCTDDRLSLLIKIWDNYKNERRIVTAACGLVANLAIMDESEDFLIRNGVLGRLIFAGRYFYEAEDILRNCSAALSNLSHGSAFAKSLVKCRGISVLYKMLAETVNNTTMGTLVHNALLAMGLPLQNPVNSLHIAAQRYDEALCKDVLEDSLDEGLAMEEDCDGKTPLDYAILAEKFDNVRLLASVGAPAISTNSGTLSSEVRMALLDGQKVFMQTKSDFVNSVADAVQYLPMDIAGEIVSNIPGEELHFSHHQRTWEPTAHLE